MKELVIEYALPGLIAFILALGTLVLRKFTNWLMEKANAGDVEKEAMQLLLEGMAVAQEEVVREAKAAAVDGKLTKEEITKARDVAINFAKNAATGPAKDIIISWSASRVSSLIKQLLSKLASKKGAANVNNTVAVSPDPENIG